MVLASILDILLTSLGKGILSFLRVGPQLARVIRILRITRLLKLVKSLHGLQQLIETLIFSLPSLLNVGALLLLIFFIYAILGVFLFKDIYNGEIIDSYINFSNFGYAMLTIFKVSTGEDWSKIMFDLTNSVGNFFK